MCQLPATIRLSDHAADILDISAEYPTDHAHFQSRMSDELRNQIVNFGPFRPKGPFSVNDEFGRQTFSENHYHVTSGGITIERLWLCFSSQMNRPNCQSCWLFGDQSSQQKEWRDGVPEIRSTMARRSSHTKTRKRIVVHVMLLHSGCQGRS